MATVSSKVAARIGEGLKRFQPILSGAKSKDVNESNTVVIITDMLSEIFGFDKYSEITTEHAIKGTRCDLAIVIEGAIKVLALHGIEWVLLGHFVTCRLPLDAYTRVG